MTSGGNRHTLPIGAFKIQISAEIMVFGVIAHCGTHPHSLLFSFISLFFVKNSILYLLFKYVLSLNLICNFKGHRTRCRRGNDAGREIENNAAICQVELHLI